MIFLFIEWGEKNKKWLEKREKRKEEQKKREKGKRRPWQSHLRFQK